MSHTLIVTDNAIELAPRRRYVVVWLVPALIAAALAWAAMSEVEEVTIGSGRVVPSSREQVVQTLEGGILAELLVREGSVVQQGDVLARIDDTRASSSFREADSKALALSASAARLRAEAYGGALSFPDAVRQRPDLVRNETEAYHARRKALADSVAELGRALELAEREAGIISPLVERGLAPEVDLLRVRRQMSDLRLQRAERENRYRSEANAELSRVESELSQVRENLVARRDAVSRTVVRAPMRGTVKNIRLTTIGGVLQPGTDLMELVPLDDQLLVEARIRPADVAFLHPGLSATVKLTAYDYSIYGGLNGVVEHISPDTLRDDTRPGTRPGVAEDANAYYRVMVRTTSATLANKGQPLRIIPGMTVSVEILTGRKTVLSYLLKPVSKAREAFRER